MEKDKGERRWNEVENQRKAITTNSKKKKVGRKIRKKKEKRKTIQMLGKVTDRKK